MKKSSMKYIAITMAAVVLIFAACKKKFKDYAPSSKVDGISDVWQLDSVKHFDPAKKDVIANVTELFVGSNAVELDIKASDNSYRFNSANPIYLGETGTWKFDNNDYPTKVIFTHNSLVDTLTLLRTVRTVDRTLQFQLNRYCGGGKSSVNYQFIFKRK